MFIRKAKSYHQCYSKDSSVSIVTRLWTGRPRNRGLIGFRDKRFFSLRIIRTLSGALPTSYSMGLRGLSLVGKAAEP
jgi:hypothetical protein